MLAGLVLLLVALAVHLTAFFAARFVVTRRASASSRTSLAFAMGRALAGTTAWYVAAALLVFLGTLARGETSVDEASMRVHVAAGGPAAEAGVRDGDRIVKVGVTPVASWPALKAAVAENGETPVAVEIERDGRRETVTVTPRGAPAKILVAPPVTQRPIGVGRAVVVAAAAPAGVVLGTVRAFLRVLAPSGERPEVSGPVGIVRETSNASRAGFDAGLLMAAMLMAYVLPLVLLGSVVYELFERRHERARRARGVDA